MAASVATFDSLVTNPGRLKILTALATDVRQEFVRLRGVTGLTDGNLCSHTRRLETAGLVAVEKSFRDRKPVTHVLLTPTGRAALEQHARELLAALGLPISARPPGLPTSTGLPRLPIDLPSAPSHPQPVEADDWVD